MNHTHLKFVIFSNFVALEIRDSLSIWFNSLDIQAHLTFGPYDTVIQQLLAFTGYLADYAVILLQIERWCGQQGSSYGAKNIDDFIGAVISAVARSPARPILVMSCPGTPGSELTRDVLLLEDRLRETFDGLANVDFVATRDLDTYYPVEDHRAYFVEDAIALEGMPYSQLCFATLGTMVARCIHRRFKESRKVLVVDCDNTLWSGICGESGPLGVSIGEGNRLLQEILVRQSKRGQLICLCSKNNESDVFAVLDQNPSMILRQRDLSSYRINWSPKAHNLRSLSDELSIGLDSFLFVDDDTFECESVRALCPTVQTIQALHDQPEFSKLLLQVWDFDRLPTTDEDAMRRLYYKQETERDRARSTLSLGEFLKSLDLRVEIVALKSDHLARASQLFRRVNQFNLNGIQRSASDLSCLIEEARCYTVHAADRFGDYGLVGVIIYDCSNRVLQVESLVLSCRALGRGVERHLAAHFVEIARLSGSVCVAFQMRATSKNAPLRKFLIEVGAEDERERGSLVMLDVLSKFVGEA